MTYHTVSIKEGSWATGLSGPYTASVAALLIMSRSHLYHFVSMPSVPIPLKHTAIVLKLSLSISIRAYGDANPSYIALCMSFR